MPIDIRPSYEDSQPTRFPEKLFIEKELTESAFSIVAPRIKKALIKIKESIPSFVDLDPLIVRIYGFTSKHKGGVGGMAISAQEMDILIDPDQTGVYKNHENKCIESTFAHEAHHLMRIKHGTLTPHGSREDTLGDCLVSEGLAMIFSMETGYQKIPSAPYTLTDNDITRYEKLALDSINEKRRSILDDWFIGTNNMNKKKEDRFIHGIGYFLGIRLIRNWFAYNESNGGPTSAANAVAIPSRKIIEPWLEKKFSTLSDYHHHLEPR